MIEEEIKLAVPGGFELPELADPGHGVDQAEPAGTRTLRATYWDTPDLRLARNGITLRYRTGEAGPPWQLKLPLPDRGEGVREELAEKGRTGEVPAVLRALVTGWVRTAVLAPVASLRTTRAVLRVLGPDGIELAELVDDTVSVMEGRQEVTRFRELEVERRAADREIMRWLRDQLVAAGAVEGEFTPKLVRALGPAATKPSDLPTPPRHTGQATGGAVVTAALAASARRLIEQDAPVRRGAPDAVHQMRVACRRLRSDLRTFGVLLDPEWAGSLRDELSWLADSLGAARDLEVQRERIRAAAGVDPLAPVDPDAVGRIDTLLAGQEDQALAAVLADLDTPRYAELLERVVAAARKPALTPLARRPADRAIEPLVAAAWDKMARAGRKLRPGGADQGWHRVRILAKRARYAGEAAQSTVGKRARRLAAAAESIQDLLGRHQDAVVAAETLLDIAEHHADEPRLVLTCGRLVERERAEVRAVRADFPAAWQEATSPKVTRWLAP
jgi:CHAD domain-containing protein